MTVKEILEKFRNDMEMTEVEYINFCKRYSVRNISTVIWYMAKIYVKLPKNIDTALRNELNKSYAVDK